MVISRTTVSLKKLRDPAAYAKIKGKRYRIISIKDPKDLPKGSKILIPSKRGNPLRKRKRRKKRQSLPPRDSKGRFRKRKRRSARSIKRRLGGEAKKRKRRVGRPRKRKSTKKKKRKKRSNPNNCW